MLNSSARFFVVHFLSWCSKACFRSSVALPSRPSAFKVWWLHTLKSTSVFCVTFLRGKEHAYSEDLKNTRQKTNRLKLLLSSRRNMKTFTKCLCLVSVRSDPMILQHWLHPGKSILFIIMVLILSKIWQNKLDEIEVNENILYEKTNQGIWFWIEMVPNEKEMHSQDGFVFKCEYTECVFKAFQLPKLLLIYCSGEPRRSTLLFPTLFVNTL